MMGLDPKLVSEYGPPQPRILPLVLDFETVRHFRLLELNTPKCLTNNITFLANEMARCRPVATIRKLLSQNISYILAPVPKEHPDSIFSSPRCQDSIEIKCHE